MKNTALIFIAILSLFFGGVFLGKKITLNEYKFFLAGSGERLSRCYDRNIDLHKENGLLEYEISTLKINNKAMSENQVKLIKESNYEKESKESQQTGAFDVYNRNP